MLNHAMCYSTTVKELSEMKGVEIADRLKALEKRNPSSSEYQSWRRSLPILIGVLCEAGLDQLTLALEYETPIGSRIDAVLLGTGKDDGAPLALIIELKQWSSIEENPKNMETVVSVRISAGEDGVQDRLHPVQQTLTYKKHLQQNHSNVAAGKIAVLCCQYLHNFEHKQQLFEGNYADYRKYIAETYVKDEREKLVSFLRDTFSPQPNRDAVALFLDGTYTFGTCCFDALRRVCENEENAVMIDDQTEVNKRVARVLQRLKANPEHRELVVISGAPGTGKTVVGLHLLWMYGQLFRRNGRYGSKCVFSLPRSKTLSLVITGASQIAPVYLESVRAGMDLVVVDEAHRIEHLNRVMHSLLEKAKVVVVLQDDRQRIRLSEEGTRASFERFAEKINLPVSKLRLKTQKRAGYLGNYVSSLDKLLYERYDANIEQNGDIEVACWDSLHALDNHLRQLRVDNNHVKWYAPFCWAWTKNVQQKDISIQTEEGIFEKPWNPINGQYEWYLGETADTLDQVGCIYTAQGLEFDYTGVIWWDDLRWNEKRTDWEVNLNASYDQQLIRSISEFYGGELIGNAPPWNVRDGAVEKGIHTFLRDKDVDLNAIKELILNTYRVLLTRARKGVFIWFKDGMTAEHFRKVMGAHFLGG